MRRFQGVGLAITIALGFVAIPAASPASASPFDWCSRGDVCVFEHREFGGYTMHANMCGNYLLGNSSIRPGQRWNDRVSSIVNNSSNQAIFYNYDGTGDPSWIGNWDVVIRVDPRSYLRDLSQNAAYEGGGNANDKIDVMSISC
jgi:Peptidase inhibitor family I36